MVQVTFPQKKEQFGKKTHFLAEESPETQSDSNKVTSCLKFHASILRPTLSRTGVTRGLPRTFRVVGIAVYLTREDGREGSICRGLKSRKSVFKSTFANVCCQHFRNSWRIFRFDNTFFIEKWIFECEHIFFAPKMYCSRIIERRVYLSLRKCSFLPVASR